MFLLRSLFFILLLVGRLSLAQNTDFRMLDRINARELPGWDRAMLNTSRSVYIAMPVTVFAITAEGYVTRHRSRYRDGVKTALSVGLATGITTAIKVSVNRPRPKIQYPGQISERDKAGIHSFPSGHTTTAFATATALSLTYKKWYVTIPAYTYAALAGYSRMRLGMHFPTDVLVGMVVGTGATYMLWELDKKLEHKRRAKKKKTNLDD